MLFFFRLVKWEILPVLPSWKLNGAGIFANKALGPRPLFANISMDLKRTMYCQCILIKCVFDGILTNTGTLMWVLINRPGVAGAIL